MHYTSAVKGPCYVVFDIIIQSYAHVHMWVVGSLTRMIHLQSANPLQQQESHHLSGSCHSVMCPKKLLHEEDYKDARCQLKEEYRTNSKGKHQSSIKLLIEKMQQRRRKWILEERPHVRNILEEFPFFFTMKSVLGVLFL